MRKRLNVDKISDLLDKNKTDSLMIVSDVDGILTNGIIGYTKDGKVMKFFGGHDKEAIQLAVNHLGCYINFVSDDKIGWDITEARLSHIREIDPMRIGYQIANAETRKQLVQNYIEHGYKVLFIGDSISDIPAMSVATYAATTKNSAKLVQQYVDYVSTEKGGEGGFADILMHFIIEPNLNSLTRI